MDVTSNVSTVRNIPKFKDRANWSRDTFQPMRGRACVYQQTNQNIAPVIKNFENNGPCSMGTFTAFITLSQMQVNILSCFNVLYTIRQNTAV